MGKQVLFAILALGALGYVIYAQQPASKAPSPATQPEKPPAFIKPTSPEKEFTISTTTRLVLLDVSVKDTAGGFAAGLTKENFKVMEDGKPQAITQFADADIPVTIGLAIDESGSMRPKRPEVITAALSFITASNPQDEMFVLNFNERVRHGLPDTMMFSDNIKQLRAALSSGVPEGRTALYDAIVEGLKQLELGRKDKKTLIVVSDGGDNVSKATLKDVVRLVEESAATVYTIGVFDSDDPDRNPGILKRLAEISGGQAYFPEKLDGIVPVCKGIAKEIRTRYTIGYIPATEGKKVRHIKVIATAPDRGKLIARTRSLYSFPDEGQVADRSK